MLPALFLLPLPFFATACPLICTCFCLSLPLSASHPPAPTHLLSPLPHPQAQAQGHDLSPYHHYILLLPAGAGSPPNSSVMTSNIDIVDTSIPLGREGGGAIGCSWGGLGTLGPVNLQANGSYGYSYAWVRADNALTLQVRVGYTGQGLSFPGYCSLMAF